MDYYKRIQDNLEKIMDEDIVKNNPDYLFAVENAKLIVDSEVRYRSSLEKLTNKIKLAGTTALLLLMLLIPARANARSIDMGTFKLTAYCGCESCSCGWGRMTYSGKIAREGVTVAADLSVMNIGDTITIDGKEYTVEDCGGGVIGDHIDIFFDDHEAVDKFGVQYGEVIIWR